LDDFAEDFFSLHAARWHARGEPGVLAAPSLRTFHREALHALFCAGLVRLHALRHEGCVIAAQYVLQHRTCAWSYLSGFDPQWSALSPGTLLMAHSIERAIEEGGRTFDLLRGEEPYKALWTTRVHETARAWLPAHPLRG
jgi:CelD/BcsL family acetyltransferase involved in cellulose biosynthesis